MIQLLQLGRYKLIETKKLVKVLYLDEEVFAWPETPQYGEMLIITHATHKTDRVLGVGEYRLYMVVDELRLTDSQHLELQLGDGSWQGYLLLSGLPDGHKHRARIMPTHEVIADDPAFRKRIDLHNLVVDCDDPSKSVAVLGEEAELNGR